MQQIIEAGLPTAPMPPRQVHSSEAALAQGGGVAVTLASSQGPENLRALLAGLARHTAFDLVALDRTEAGAGWIAKFRLRAVRGAVGDTQIYALLRFLTGDVRWVDVKKEPAPALSDSLIPTAEGHRPGAA